MSSSAEPRRPMPGMGLVPDAPDRRDRALYAAIPNIDALPDRADCSALLPPVMDQHSTSACVGFSAATVMHAVMVKDGHRRPFVPSPVFIYREARVLGGYVEEDMGTEIRLAWKAANKVGLAPMSNIKPRFKAGDLADPQTGLFPADSIWRRQPAPSHYADAERRQALVYYRLATLNDLLQRLADGWPAQLGFMVFRSMYGSSGPLFEVPDPQPGEHGLGGHAVAAYGYDKPSRRVLFMNSWGNEAHQGRSSFTLSFDYVMRYSADVWTGRALEGFRPK